MHLDILVILHQLPFLVPITLIVLYKIRHKAIVEQLRSKITGYELSLDAKCHLN